MLGSIVLMRSAFVSMTEWVNLQRSPKLSK
jgi:hypothetical protein